MQQYPKHNLQNKLGVVERLVGKAGARYPQPLLDLYCAVNVAIEAYCDQMRLFGSGHFDYETQRGRLVESRLPLFEQAAASLGDMLKDVAD